MARQFFATLLETSAVALLLFGLLLGGSWQSSSGLISFSLREFTAVLLDADTQWMVFLCLAIYFTAFLFLHSYSEISLTQRRKDAKASGWLAGLFFVSAVLYAIHYSPATPALTLLAGAVIGQGMAAWAEFENRKQKAENRDQRSVRRVCIRALVMALFVILLASAAVWNDDAGRIYAYRSHTRWIGPWDNPNIFGLLMGMGMALAIGGGISLFRSSRGNAAQISKAESGNDSELPHVGFYWQKYGNGGLTVLLLVAAILMARGLLHSYSRGAWLATGCGGTYLLWRWLNREIRETNSICSSRREATQTSKSAMNRASSRRLLRIAEALRFSCVSWFHKNWLPMGFILFSIMALAFWHLRKTDWHPARRAFSVVNSADFSSRNRVAAWVGDLQVMAEHPWFGVGWNQPKPLYEHYYLPSRLTESAAIEMNDYLMLGATLGIPALFCFAMYLGLSLIKNGKLKIAAEANADGAQSLVAPEVTWPKPKSDNRNEIADNTADADRQSSDCNPQKPRSDATLEPRSASVESVASQVSVSDSLSAPGGRGEGQREVRAILHADPASSDFLAATCRAGAIVLLVGFWFDGGLFKLPTAATFWILLELGNVSAQKDTDEHVAK